MKNSPLDQDSLLEKIACSSNFFSSREESFFSPQECREYLIPNQVKNPIFYPGSFNPWHLGHDACLKACPHQEDIVLVPDNNPQKNAIHWPAVERFQFFLLHLKKHHPLVSLWPGQLLKEQRSQYTYQWFLRVNIPQKNLLLGDDQFHNFSTWKNYVEILAQLKTLYVVPRKYSQEHFEKLSFNYRQLSPNLKIIRLQEHEFQNLSSSQIRALNAK